MKKLYVWLLGALVILTSCGLNDQQWANESKNTNSRTGHQAMMDDKTAMHIAHCEMMPGMDWCHEYNDSEIESAMKISCPMMPGMDGCDKYLQPETDEDLSDLPSSHLPEIVELADGETYEIMISEVRKEIDGEEVKMLAYNDMIPGPILKVQQWSKIFVSVTNQLDDHETTVHWHWLRVTPENDGVPKDMWWAQDPMWHGDEFTYELVFPDEWMYWYHPHIREDQQQELGLSGNLWVVSTADDWNPVDQEHVIILDDIGVEWLGQFDDEADHTLMGRFWDTYLLNGQEDFSINLTQWSISRIYLTNVANSRTFRFALPWAKMKLVWWDLWRYEHDQWVEYVDLAPAERAIVEVKYEDAGSFAMLNDTPSFTHEIGSVEVLDWSETEAAKSFGQLSVYSSIKESMDPYRDYLDIHPDKTIRLGIEMDMWHDMSHMVHESPEWIEWADTMPMMNQMSNSSNTRWKIIDEDSLEENMMINWTFTQWDVVKIRIFNDPDSVHPMQHPIHFHGQRFLITHRDDVKEENLVWKDTILVPTWSTYDIILDTGNPGRWMAHCHIAEHLTNGMMMNFEVLPSNYHNENQLRIINVNARRFMFEPNVIKVKQWEKVKIVVNNEDMLHGIAIPQMELYADEELIIDTSIKWTFPFWCANFCGNDHENMRGKIIVE